MNRTKKRSKKNMIKIILPAVFLILLIIGGIAARLFYLAAVSKGVPIASYDQAGSALLVLDVQNDTVGIKEYTNSKALLENINKAITYAETNGIEIMYTRQEFTNPLDKMLTGGMYGKGSKGAELSNELEMTAGQSFSKVKSDAFSSQELEQYLIDHNISTLYVAGADASTCVYKTALAGVNRDYEVVILEDCVFSVKESLFENMKEKYLQNNIKLETLSQFTAK